jgi:tetratricopeptide (TPR) repeat protein
LSRVIGDRARARDVAERAQLVDPLAPVAYGGAGAVFYHTRDYERSIAAHLHGLALDSTYWVSRGLLAKTYLAAGRPRDALKELRIIPPPFGGIHGGPAIVGTAFAQLGMIDSARAMLATALRQPTKSYDLAILYTALHDNDAAFAALDRAMAERDPFVVCLRNDPLLDALKGDARFERVARMMKLPAVPANDPR